MSTRIGWWVTCPDELNLFKFDELLVRRPPKAAVLSDLSEEGNDHLCAISILIWKINLITEDNEPFFWVSGPHNNSLRCLLILTVVVELLHDQLWPCRRGEVDENHLHLWQLLQRRHKSHGLTRSWWSAEQEGPVLAEPAAKYLLMSTSIYCIDNSVGIYDFAWLNLH